MSGHYVHWFVNAKHCFMMVVLLLDIPSVSQAVSFDFPYFVNCANDIMCEGDAAAYKGTIELNNAQSCRVGRVKYAGKMQLWDSSSGILADLVTRFSFRVDCENCSDGLAFFLIPSGTPIPPNSHGGNLGLFTQTTGNQIVSVEFDTWQNQEYDPPGDDMIHHVGINVNSLGSSAYDAWNFTAGQPTEVEITYNGTTKNLGVSWSSQFYNGKIKQISYIIDLREILPEWITFGISAATGFIYEKHTILSWEFSSTLNAKAVTASKKNLITFMFAVGASVIIIVVLISMSSLVLRKKRKGKATDLASIDFDLERRSLPRRFNYQELVTATNGFSSSRRLGTGGTGQVYKGLLSDLGRIVAVKRIFADPDNSEKFFINEVQIISRLIHRNLVQFVGWCHEKNEFLLVYDYMPNGSLDTHLYGKKKTIPWKMRYKIALGLASALNYLHEDAEQCVLHRDIKSANVLLDTDYTCKLGDFGVAKLVDHVSRTTQMTGVVGTYGYLAPEYVKKGMASKESDLYSFGVVALEIACGRRCFQDGDNNHIPLTWWVWKLYLEEKILNAADDRLNMDFDACEMKCLLTLGLWCTHPKDKERPKAGQVIKVLLDEAPLPTLPHDMHDLDDLRNSGEGFKLQDISTRGHDAADEQLHS